METVKTRACAKINTYLEITGRREDGFHDIDSIMQSVSLCDYVTVTLLNTSGTIILEMPGTDIPCDQKNIAYKAAESILTYTNSKAGFRIHIDKRIPTEAGLGGGSTDGAAVLRACNQLLGTGLSFHELTCLGAGIGADIPFCVQGGRARAQGIGECLAQLPDAAGMILVVAKAGDGVSTPEAYRLIDQFEEKNHFMWNKLPETSEINHLYFNRFEDVILPVRNKINELKTAMVSCGAKNVLMSGSGAAVFGSFEKIDAAEKTAEKIKANGCFATVCETVSSDYCCEFLT